MAGDEDVAPASRRAEHFELLQAYRGIAAAAVVLDHLHFQSGLYQGPGLLPDAFRYGHLGVDFFFVLSGFIIQHVHGADAGHPERAGDYLWRRAARIWPLLALLTTLKLAYMLVSGAGVRAEKFDPRVIVASYLCLPQPGWPVLDIAWTLQHEALFYALFLVPILLGRRAWRVLLALWMGLIALGIAGVLPRTFPLSFLASPWNAEFALGVGASVWIRSRPPDVRGAVRLLAITVLLLGVGTALYTRAHTTEEKAVRLVLALGLMTGVVASITLERAGRLRAPGWLKRLGDGSYSLYLWHGFVIGAALTAWPRLPASVRAAPRLYLAACLVVTFVSSSLLYHRVERPLSARFRGLRAKRGARSGTGEAA